MPQLLLLFAIGVVEPFARGWVEAGTLLFTLPIRKQCSWITVYGPGLSTGDMFESARQINRRDIGPSWWGTAGNIILGKYGTLDLELSA